MHPTRLLYATSALLALSTVASAQATARIDTLRIQQTTRTFLDVALEGEVVLITWSEPYTRIITTSLTQGRVHGLSNMDSRDAYALLTVDSVDVIWVRARSRVPLRTWGISTYRESLSHEIMVPPHTSVALTVNRGDLEIRSAPATLVATLETGDALVRQPKDGIRLWHMTATDGITGLGAGEAPSLTRRGAGQSVLAIEARNGRVRVVAP